jgi:N-methylhydantoinase A/oxoprolinase/acetone carboxylase beta subunit
MGYRIAVDIGGTFTDCVVVSDAGERTVAKALTTSGALADGVLDALAAVAAELELDLPALLGATDAFVHGTTQATNAIVTRSGARTALITTKGHEDALVIGRLYSKIAGLPEREIVHSSQLDKPEPIVPRALTRGVTERVDRDGEVLVELDLAEARAAIDSLRDAGVEAIAVSFLWSFLNDSHERAVRTLLAERAPEVFVALSSEIAPVLGEYERGETTALAAYVGPGVVGYLELLEARLRAEGLRRPLLVMQASGGLTSVSDAAQRPIVTLDSGPTGGILGCLELARTYGEENVVCTDVGGTTFDVGLILGGRLPSDSEPVIARHSLRMPKVLVESIGAGGGSVAWLDEGGLLRVGPRSAGSSPGPACYGRGGSEPTVTDADLVLGYLDAEHFLGGRMRLDRDAAHAALAHLGARLGLEPEELAAGVFRIINAQMADLIRKTTIALGHDPRECILVAYGGAGPTHAAFYGADIAVKEILIPADSTAFSAEGMLTCDMIHVLERSIVAPEALERGFAELEARVLDQFAREGTPAEKVAVERAVDVHYGQQVQTLAVPVKPGVTMAELAVHFARLYEETFGAGAGLAGSPVELSGQRVTATLAVARPPFAELPDAGADPGPALRTTREAYFAPDGLVATAVYDGYLLAAGNVVSGPAIIERMGDSVVVPPGAQASLDRQLTLHLRPS